MATPWAVSTTSSEAPISRMLCCTSGLTLRMRAPVPRTTNSGGCLNNRNGVKLQQGGRPTRA